MMLDSLIREADDEGLKLTIKNEEVKFHKLEMELDFMSENDINSYIYTYYNEPHFLSLGEYKFAQMLAARKEDLDCHI